jgi:CDP-diacylglycerol--serine O-phosphatidyltransferase
MAPAYAGLAGIEIAPAIALFWLPLVAILMVSRWPTFSGKSIGRKTTRLLLLPPLILGSAAAMCLLAYPWATLLGLCFCYAATIPLGGWRYAILLRRIGNAADKG